VWLVELASLGEPNLVSRAVAEVTGVEEQPGRALLQQGDYERAAPLFAEGLVLGRELEDKRTIAYTVHNLGEVARHRGEYGQAVTLYTESLSVSREIEDNFCIVVNLGWLGVVALRQGDHETAAELLKEGLALAQELEKGDFLAMCLEGLAGLAGAEKEAQRAARLFGAAETLREAIGVPIPPADSPDYDRDVAAARSQLEEAEWEEAWAEGKAMTLEEVIEYTLSEEECAVPAALGQSSTETQQAALSRRERQLAYLVAQGLTNRQIARELFISERTVENHVSRMLKKLDLRSREQIASLMAEQR
jgi:DNA-binding CsgD family transcriptional regulator